MAEILSVKRKCPPGSRRALFLLSDSSVLSWENLPARVFGNLLLILKVVTKYFRDGGLTGFPQGVDRERRSQLAREWRLAGRSRFPSGKTEKKGGFWRRVWEDLAVSVWQVGAVVGRGGLASSRRIRLTVSGVQGRLR
jgi:hypothetical protein